jgi:hypothetical protein
MQVISKAAVKQQQSSSKAAVKHLAEEMQVRSRALCVLFDFSSKAAVKQQ